ncbi:hypothetical protein ACFV3R_25565 [Streptomyces sp. NPDC059740]|uniref:hypothetical protein n=1 Tax=Streptomyces sp. NPDC059740 TaxID=3346926 RepID=UPI003646A29C
MTGGRGRPVKFDESTQGAYLKLVAEGVRLGEAADRCGISRRTPTQLATRNPDFADRLAQAKTAGRTWRAEHLVHGRASTYNLHACRCTPCTTAATTARRTHSHTTPQPHRTAQILTLPRTNPTTATTQFPHAS